jgi:phytoene synthase
MVTDPFTLLSGVNSCNRLPLMVNNMPEIELTPPQRLAIAYAPKVTGAQLEWLLRFDQRLQGILARAREPMIAQLRIAWWRDMLGKSVGERPSGEPLLAELAALEQSTVTEAALLLVDGWELMVGEPDADEQQRSASMRAEAIFGAFAGWAACSDAEREIALSLGRGWARQGDGQHRTTVRKLRPLSILAFAAYLEREGGWACGLRLSWHALTGR